jgi:hypothetical protein
MKVLQCKNHIIRGSCIFIKESKTRQEVSTKKIDKMSTNKIIHGKESPKNENFRNYNQSETFSAPPEDSVSYQGYSPSPHQGYSPSPHQGYSHEGYYYPSIVNSSSTNENLYSLETAYPNSFDNNIHNNSYNSWQISPENMQMSYTPNIQNNIFSQQGSSNIHSQFGNAYMGQSHGQGQ